MNAEFVHATIILSDDALFKCLVCEACSGRSACH